MSLADTFEHVKNEVFHLVVLNADNQRVASGSGFCAYGYLITNFHVTEIAPNLRVWIRQDRDGDINDGLMMSAADFLASRVASSDRNNYDYAILDIPALRKLNNIHQFKIRNPHQLRIGDSVAFAGFPFEHFNLSCHAGVVSSFYRSGPANVIQLDASVNASNSGGPLFDPVTGEVVGIVTRKATGLTNAFGHLRQAIQRNIQILQPNLGGSVRLMGIDPIEVARISNEQMLHVLGEIERQANVGIGYAFSVAHIADENRIFEAMNPEVRD